jgi:hypothetical protein
MKITTALIAAAATVATAGAVGIASVPVAGADNYPTIREFGRTERLVDGAGTIVTGWRVNDLKPSTDVIPWPVHGRLWEATATVRADRGTVTPIISDFNARASNGQTYQVLAAVATPQGVNPSTLGQGGRSTGKLYFDVVGPPPDGVVYDAGGRDLLFWVR